MKMRPDGRYRVAVKIDGKTVYVYGKTEAEVLRNVRDAKNKVKAGKLFPAVAEAFWHDHEDTLAPNTLKGYIPALQRAEDYFAKQDIARIRPVDVSRFLAKCIREMNMAEKTAKTQLMICNLIFRYAVSHGYIDVNPCTDLRVPKGLEHKKREMPSAADLATIKATTDQPFGFFAFFLLATGLRKGEALALQWKDVDITSRDITVSKSVYFTGNHPHIKQPKTEAGIRKVPILNALLPYLHPAAPDDYIFHGVKTTEPMPQSWYTDGWEHYVKKNKLHCTAHMLRHAYATMLYEEGVSEGLAQVLLGHAHISTTHDIYTHIREEETAKARHAILDMKMIS